MPARHNSWLQKQLCRTRTAEFIFGVEIISYARVRLWIGIIGVGMIVVACLAAILFGLPQRVLASSRGGIVADLSSLLIFIGAIVTVMAPLDLVGGYVAPNRFGRQSASLPRFLARWIKGVVVQAALFFLSAVVILVIGRHTGLLGAVMAVIAMAIAYTAFQKRLVLAMAKGNWDVSDDKVTRALDRARRWGFEARPVRVILNSDPGFTGGVCGLPRLESIVIPRDFVDRLTVEQLAVVLARRLAAVESGGRTRGLVVALLWIAGGFSIAASLPGAGVTSVAELATTCLGFTVWTFLGLLTLPTLSRQSSYAIDQEVLLRGVKRDALAETIQVLDGLQDDEPMRSALVETIFHPVPSVDNRKHSHRGGLPLAWHAARMTLFLSWSCMGMLARAVHCNVGRPELWVMLPTD